MEYQSKDGKETEVFDALEWLAAMLGAAKPCEDGCSHVPGKGWQADFAMVAYGYYGNVARGKRKKDDADDNIPCILESKMADLLNRLAKQNVAIQ